ncbi:hypothetical protein VOLCADRAFT_94253 [Volvox carteri f. nagariensis]|uniref:Peptidase S54 rhomboid domain-containing protein n=1 Tax=Volvox carteri f. nagariensis TaxID=3068 RepID=D8U408_VOLCA|nr:uncharacterized protein VOLCADRAFT_94253 [Volvox carteri f. nagariensis]EFJ45414.1 hypothetical protein VOLCADRAFT_94253 [Volvox carteri f. nagariensis]|eukprot:XP_002953441.1 hypothetical protein VOLCADRAFT_94253 [Volvox carteri f. nagariensis]
MTSIDNLGIQISAAAQEAWNTVGATVNKFTSSVFPTDSSRLNQILRPPVDRTLAALRWSNFGSSAVVPFTAPHVDDPRMVVTILGLANVVFNELQEHQRHQPTTGSSSSDGGPSLPLPPVTLALVAASVWRYLNPVLLREVCLSPYCVIDRNEVGRLWTASLTHLDLPHLMSNLASLLPDAAVLERQEGSALFIADVALLSTLSSGLFVGWAVLEKQVLQRTGTYYAVGAVGLSSLAFALQVVADETRAGGERRCLGLPLPGRFSWVLSLGFTHLVSAPDTSFAGHMCGVLAGIAHVYLIRPALRTLLRSLGNGVSGGGGARPRPRFYGGGTLSGRPLSAGYTAPTPRRSLMSALSQLGLAAGAIVVYTLASRRRERQPLSNWSLRSRREPRVVCSELLCLALQHRITVGPL